MIFRFAALTTIMLGTVFGLKLHGLAGALILGVTVVIIDYTCIRWRFHFFQKCGTSLKLAVVIGGLSLRLINLVFFLRLGSWWLVPTIQHFLHWIMITIPLWNLLTALHISINHSSK